MKIIILGCRWSSPNMVLYPHLTRVRVGRAVPTETLTRISGCYSRPLNLSKGVPLFVTVMTPYRDVIWLRPAASPRRFASRKTG